MARRSGFIAFINAVLAVSLSATSITFAPTLLFAQNRSAAQSFIPQTRALTNQQQQPPVDPTPLPQQLPQDDADAEVVRVMTDLVMLPVSVLDRRGRYVIDLLGHDFRIYEEGTEQKISHFGSVDHPFSVTLLLDTSGSTAAHLANMKSAARSFLQQLRPADQVSVVTFDGEIKSLDAATPSHDRAALLLKIDAIRNGSSDIGTRLYDAVDFALRAQTSGIQRQAIVLFTDGTNTWGKATEKSTLRQAADADVQIYTVRYGNEPTEKYLRSLAEKTGGRYLLTEASDQNLLKQTFAEIATELRHQYSLGYYRQPAPDGGVRRQQRRIKIQVRRPHLQVKTKASLMTTPENTRR